MRILGIALLFFSFVSFADCMQDIDGQVRCGKGMCERDEYGHVFCAKTLEGGAMRNQDGQVVCGVGQCVQTLDGDVLCSAEKNGGAAADLEGEVKCSGGCIKATNAQCDNRLGQ
ncbi:hypothetical protein HR060_11390 [Catenovulum sp. SM1970]|uniref:hypothetical protein n=1 Tax=Marinifaba aquimaris TaxID=2741323 RepID=UPI00157306D8|nr:hypothetical protein [Marinifaba aquimaris]NTS77465.1 hypothetical protein [Marinifaba aquimaris]